MNNELSRQKANLIIRSLKDRYNLLINDIKEMKVDTAESKKKFFKKIDRIEKSREHLPKEVQELISREMEEINARKEKKSGKNKEELEKIIQSRNPSDYEKLKELIVKKAHYIDMKLVSDYISSLYAEKIDKAEKNLSKLLISKVFNEDIISIRFFANDEIFQKQINPKALNKHAKLAEKIYDLGVHSI